MPLPTVAEIRDRNKTNSQVRDLLAQLIENVLSLDFANANAFFKPQIIPNGTDVNNLSSGFWVIPSETVALTLINLPTLSTPMRGFIFVMRNGGYINYQKLVQGYNAAEIVEHERTGNIYQSSNANFAWLPWQKVVNEKRLTDLTTSLQAWVNAIATVKPVDLTGNETIENLPNGKYYVTSSTVATALDAQLPASMTSPKVCTIEITNRNNVIREIEIKRYTANAQGEYEIFRKVSTGAASSLSWLPWQKDPSRYEIEMLKASTPVVNLAKYINFESSEAARFQATVTNEDGYVVASIAETPSNAAIFYEYAVDGKQFVVGKQITASIEMNSDKTGSSGGDISIVAYDNTGVTLGSTITTKNSVANTFENLVAVMTLPAGTAKFAIRFIRRAGNTYVKLRKYSLQSNTWAANTIVQAPMIGVGHLNTYISSTGSDTTGDGSISNPYQTVAKAQSVMSGVGDLLIKAGDYSALQVDVAKAKDIAVIALSDSSLGRPKIRYGTKLTGISFVSGKVYKAGITLSGQPNAIWHDGVADTKTLVPTSEIHFGLRGRSHRLNCTKIEKTTATSRAAAIAEIQSASDPRCFYDASANEILFAIASGGDATSANIYVPVTGGTQTLFTGRSSLYVPPASKIQLVGLDVLYGSINNVGASARIELDDCSVLGPAANAYDLVGSIVAVNCEAAGYGSGFTTTGDGFNFHNNAHIEHRYLYMHDGYDDGISSHENCFELGFGGISEYNGGGGFTPAYGAQGRLDNCISRKNNGVASRFNTNKTAGFECHSANTGGGGDISTLTSFEVFNCISIGDKNGFMDMFYKTGSNSRMKAYNCTSIDPVEYGFACSEIQDCSHSGTGIAKAPDVSGRSVLVRNTSKVV